MNADVSVPSTQPDEPGHEFRLVVWTAPGRRWRARLTGLDAVARDFESPFELARFVAWPVETTPSMRPTSGLR